MTTNERKPGESIKQWKDRIKAQNKEQITQKRIDSVKKFRLSSSSILSCYDRY